MKRPENKNILRLLNSYHSFLIFYVALRTLFGGWWWWLALLNTFALFLFVPLLLSLPLALLLGAQRPAVVSLLLLLFGGFNFMPLKFIQTTKAVEASLRVVTFNVLLNNPQLKAVAEWLLTLDADVIVLQEIVAEGQEPRLSPLRMAYPHVAYVPGNVRIYSRYAFIESQLVTIEAATHTHAKREAVRAVLDIDGKPVVIYGVHLSLPIGEKRRLPLLKADMRFAVLSRYDETRRNTQINNLLHMVEREPLPVIVAGDFNMSDSSTIYHSFSRAGLVDSFAAAGRGWGMTWANFLPFAFLRIDYIWHTPDINTRAARTGPAQGSDHLPLIADLSLS